MCWPGVVAEVSGSLAAAGCVTGPEGRQRPVLCVEKEANDAAKGISDENLFAELRKLGEAAGVPPMHSMKIHPEFPVDIRHNAKIFREQLAVWAGEAQ